MVKHKFRLEWVIVAILIISLVVGLVVVVKNAGYLTGLQKDVKNEQFKAFLYQCMFEHDFPSDESCGYVLCQAEFQKSQGDEQGSKILVEAYQACEEALNETKI